MLVRELTAQKRDLEGVLARWVKFADNADRFALLIIELRDKVRPLYLTKNKTT